jgi:subtilase family serine protease
LSPGDHSKIVAWLTSEGFTVKESGRARNWIAFSGTAEQVSTALHTQIRRFVRDGEGHFANTSEPAVPEALADVVGGFLGLNDFRLTSRLRTVTPDFTSGTSHYMVPQDFATIYNLTPLYQAGIDGTGLSIAVVGQSEVLLSDLRAFRTRYSLPANDPTFLLYSGSSPGFTGSEIEGDLDLEWASALAPNAKITYVYGASALTALTAAVNLNVAPIVSISYGFCEVNFRLSFYRAIAQQGNAQGITFLSASGESCAAACDSQASQPVAAGGRTSDFP